MLRKLISSIFILVWAVNVAAATSSSDSESGEDVNYTKLCIQKTPDPSEFGFVCLETRSQQYLQCYLPGNVALLMNCPAGTFCSYIEGEWTTSNPCGK